MLEFQGLVLIVVLLRHGSCYGCNGHVGRCGQALCKEACAQQESAELSKHRLTADMQAEQTLQYCQLAAACGISQGRAGARTWQARAFRPTPTDQ